MHNKPQGIVRLTGQLIDDQISSCTGMQMVKVLETLAPNLRECRWLVADVSTNEGDLPISFDHSQIFYLKDIQALIEFSKQVDQFWSGVFLAVPNTVESPTWNRSFDTEDEPTQDLESAVFEIRAFDASYFEIYSVEIDVLRILSERFTTSIHLTKEQNSLLD